jgi:hypothetical protein
LETLDSKVKLEGPSKSPRESPPPSQDAGRPFKIKEDGEDGDRERSSTPKGCQGKTHMRGLQETQMGQLVGRPMCNKEEFPRQLQGPKTAKATQTHSGEMKDHTRNHEDHDRRTGVRDAEPQGSCCIRQDQRTKLACEDQKND